MAEKETGRVEVLVIVCSPLPTR